MTIRILLADFFAKSHRKTGTTKSSNELVAFLPSVVMHTAAVTKEMMQFFVRHLP
jgi:hypothetical protein